MSIVYVCDVAGCALAVDADQAHDWRAVVRDDLVEEHYCPDHQEDL